MGRTTSTLRRQQDKQCFKKASQQTKTLPTQIIFQQTLELVKEAFIFANICQVK
jgi:hypothetical protein